MDSETPVIRSRWRTVLLVAVVVLALDIATKLTVVATLTGRPAIRVIGSLLMLREERNSGAAFSIGPSLTLVYAVIAICVIVVIVRASRRIASLPWALALGLILGGAMGNLSDRLFRYPGPLRGWVVDWIQLPHWPTFNLADSAIVCGAILSALLAVRGTRLDGSPPPAQSTEKSTPCASGSRPE